MNYRKSGRTGITVIEIGMGCEGFIDNIDGTDPLEANGHIDDMACFVRPGKVCCIYSVWRRQYSLHNAAASVRLRY